MFTSIIVGFDGSDGSRDALALALRLAEADASIALVDAYPADAGVADIDGYVEARRLRIARMLADAAADDPRCEPCPIGSAFPGQALHAEASRRNAELIVIGPCVRSLDGHAVMGSVARSALDTAPCAVAIAVAGYRDWDSPIEAIGVGYKSCGESAAALDQAQALAISADGELELMTVIGLPASFAAASPLAAGTWQAIEGDRRRVAEEALAEVIGTLEVPVSGEVVDGVASDALLQLSGRVDLLVTGSRGHGPIKRVVIGSTSNRLAHNAHCPLLVVPRAAVGERAARAKVALHA